VNIIGSSLFLIALGLLYSLTGTLNMAQMGLRIAAIGPDDQWLLRVAALLLVGVFALKSALVPLHLWLPRTYAVATPAVAALFAIMTKVGVYSLIRVVPQVLGEDAGSAAWAPAPYLLPAAILTAVVGFAGVFVARRLSEQAAYAIIGSTGTLIIAVAAWQVDTLGAALYYLVHSTLAGAALFLVADVVARRRASFADTISSGPVFCQQQTVGLLFLAAAIATVGLPPLSGFIGKLLIMESVADTASWGWVWAAIVLTTLAGVIGFARAGSAIFWKEGNVSDGAEPTNVAGFDMAAPVIALLMQVALSAGAGPATAFGNAAAAQLLDAPATARAVLRAD
jgi:multicomponent K+:H+ antiporter subunit D